LIKSPVLSRWHRISMAFKWCTGV